MAEASRSAPFLGLWGWLVAIGLGLVALASLISLLTNLPNLDGEDVAPTLFRVVGGLLAALALAAAGLFLRDVNPGIRVALVLGGCYFLLGSGSLASLLSFL